MNIISQCRETSVVDSLQKSASGHEYSGREKLFFPWRLVPLLERRLICQHTNEDVKYTSWSRHTWNFPRNIKDISLVPVLEIYTFRSKGMRSDHTVQNDQFFSFLLWPNISRPFPLVLSGWTLSFPPYLNLWVRNEHFITVMNKWLHRE